MHVKSYLENAPRCNMIMHVKSNFYDGQVLKMTPRQYMPYCFLVDSLESYMSPVGRKRRFNVERNFKLFLDIQPQIYQIQQINHPFRAIVFTRHFPTSSHTSTSFCRNLRTEVSPYKLKTAVTLTQ